MWSGNSIQSNILHSWTRFDVEYIYGFVRWGGLHAKSMRSQRYRATYKMADMRFMATLLQQQDGGYMLFYIFNSTVVDWTCFLLPTDAHNVKKRRVIKTF